MAAMCQQCLSVMRRHCHTTGCDWLYCTNDECRAVYSPSRDRWTRREAVVYARPTGRHRRAG